MSNTFDWMACSVELDAWKRGYVSLVARDGLQPWVSDHLKECYYDGRWRAFNEQAATVQLLRMGKYRSPQGDIKCLYCDKLTENYVTCCQWRQGYKDGSRLNRDNSDAYYFGYAEKAKEAYKFGYRIGYYGLGAVKQFQPRWYQTLMFTEHNSDEH